MATLINNAGVQHYANKMVLAENRKVGSKSLPTALADIDNLIDEMKTHFDAEYGSALDMKLNNNENVFSVGTGIDIDKRSEVENSFTDVELSGNSLVNLVSSEIKSMTSTRTSGWHQDRSYKYSDMIKPNTTYTIVCQVLKNTLSTPFGMGGSTKTYNQLNFNTFKNFAPKETGIKISVVQSYDEWDKTQALILFPQFGNRGEEEGLFEIGETIEYRFMIFEGDYSNNPPTDFFQGLKSVGEKEDGNNKLSISSVGKNLLPIPDCFVKDSEDKILINVPSKYDNIARFMNCKKVILSAYVKGENIQPVEGTSYHYGLDISLKGYGSQLSGGSIWISLTKGVLPQSGSFEGWYHTEVTFQNTTTITGLNRVNLFLRNMTGKLSMSNIQLEIVDAPQTKPTHYQPYILDKKEILLNEPLRGIPNGIKDTIEKVNGEWKIVRKVGSIVLNGSEPWKEQVDGSTEEFLDIRCGYPTLLNRNRQNGLCDKFNYITKGSPIGEQEGIQLYTHTTQSQFIASMSKSRFSTVDSFKEYLAQNHTTVLYELATPIIEDISPVTLQCWKNGTISIDEVLPVETTHTVALNKPAQIKRNIEELTALRKRVKKLEEMYDDIALEQAYKLSLINFNFELDNN